MCFWQSRATVSSAALGKAFPAGQERQVILPLYSGLVRHIWSAGSGIEETWTNWNESSEVPQR